MENVSVLFVCMGNICRSPTAHGVFRQLVEQAGYAETIKVDSAGTHAYHVGEGADSRAVATARSRGIDLSDLRARQVEVADFQYFDYVIAMDHDNYRILDNLCPVPHRSKISLFLDFDAHGGESEVPDPYYGGEGGFDHVFDLVQAASMGLLKNIEARLYPNH